MDPTSEVIVNIADVENDASLDLPTFFAAHGVTCDVGRLLADHVGHEDEYHSVVLRLTAARDQFRGTETPSQMAEAGEVDARSYLFGVTQTLLEVAASYGSAVDAQAERATQFEARVPVRAAIVGLLSGGAKSVREIAEFLEIEQRTPVAVDMNRALNDLISDKTLKYGYDRETHSYTLELQPPQ